MSNTNDIDDTNVEDRKQQVRELISRFSTADRRKVEKIMDENDDLRRENRRLLEDRRSEGGDFFGNLMIISIIFFILAVLIYFGIPLYIKSQPYIIDEVSIIFSGLLILSSVGILVFPILGTVFWFLKKK